jgi:hypothetical protein
MLVKHNPEMPTNTPFFSFDGLCVSVSLWLRSVFSYLLEPCRPLSCHAKCSLERQTNLPDQTVVE